MTKKDHLRYKIFRLLNEKPWLQDFFDTHGIDSQRHLLESVYKLTENLPNDFYENIGSTKALFREDFLLFIDQMDSLLNATWNRINALTILPGTDKEGRPEAHEFTLAPGEITAIVGPTGSGKSRLLEDIECLAKKDTPTTRQILVNGTVPDDALRFSSDKHLVAQLSQNMNFVMDLSVRDFLMMHAESRMVKDPDTIIGKIFSSANDLAGEAFSFHTPLTELSGGQSRALMIADTALLSKSPIILIDEIENAGVDKVNALELLKSSEKIILISTHDPVIALSAARRIIIKNGGIHRIIETSEEEKKHLVQLKLLDRTLSQMRQALRTGEKISL